MILEWRLHQFKSVGQKKSLRFAPLTLFTGANSSGKSSIIQSILLIAQTLTSKVVDRQLVLNGELEKLGTFTDVLHDSAEHQEIGIGFLLSIDGSLMQRSASRGLFLFPVLGNDSKYRFDVDLLFTPVNPAGREKAESLQARLTDAVFDFKPITAAPSDIPEAQGACFTIRRRADEEMSQLWPADLSRQAAIVLPAGKEALRYSITSDKDINVLIQRWYGAEADFGSSEPLAVDLEHFLPIHVIRRFNQTARMVMVNLSALLQPGLGPVGVRDRLREWSQSPEPVKRIIAETLEDRGDDAIQKIGALLRSRARRGTGDKEIDELVRAIIEAASRTMPRQIGFELTPAPPQLAALRAGVVQYFAGSMRYLGPLRDDPKPVYAVATSSDPSTVGVKGELTASVLDLHANTFVDFIDPGTPEGPVKRIALRDAVRAWVKYLDIADSFSTVDEGKLGHRLYIQPAGIKRNVDLTNVGVGVSQVLPIVVMALISEPGAALLFEQPELHLHPKVQSRLADFFLAVIRTGRQCIVETHSEYLINRLRLRIAQSAIGASLNDQIVLYFVERQNQSSHYREVKINEYGAIPQWPAGFFVSVQ